MNWGLAVLGYVVLVLAMAGITTAYDAATDMTDRSTLQAYRAKYLGNVLGVGAMVLLLALALTGLITLIRGVSGA